MRIVPCRALCAGVGMLLSAGQPAAAQPAVVSIRATAGTMLGLAERLIANGEPEKARAILALLARDPNGDVRNEARYRQSLLLEADGKHAAAAVLLRQILDDRPDATAVRLKLATTLYGMGDEDSALRELRAVRSSDLPPTIARFVDRLTASLQATKPFGVQVEFALAPDSNINRATRSDTLGTIFGDFRFDQDSKAKSGLGAAVRGMVHGRLELAQDLSLTARASTEANLYRHKDFNDIAVDLSVGPEWRLGRVRLTAEGSAGQQWYGMKPFQRNYRFSAGLVAPIGSVSQLRVDVAARCADNRLNDLQDGRGLSIGVRFERALSPRLLVAASLGADRFKARDDAYSTHSWQAGIAAYRELGALTVNAGLDIGRLTADDRLLILPQARSDQLTRLTFGTVFRNLAVAGFAPMTRLVIERNKSTVEFYDYRRVRTEFGITRAF